jgi:phospholipid/cholesterol/gamma-HCH transport system substrate-binding protein
MRRNALETAIGALVIAAAIGFVAFSYTAADVASVSGYKILARFDRVDGLRQGSDVKMSGIRIGQVRKMELETDTYFAVVEMEIDAAVKLPTDTSAEIASESLLGGRFLALTPGGAEKMLEAGGEIRYTQSAVSLEQLIGKFIFSGKDGASGDDAKQ